MTEEQATCDKTAEVLPVGAVVPANNPIPQTPMEMLAVAVQRGDIKQIENMMDLQDRWEKKEAEKAFVRALAEFHKEEIIITKDMENKQYKSRYSSKGNIINTAAPYLAKHGFSYRFKPTQENGLITITCVLTHKEGHSENASFSGPPDKSGSKNDLQQIKSTKTYLEIATFEAVTGLASQEGSMDDDGNSAGAETITAEQDNDLIALAQEVGADLGKFCKYFKIADTADLPAKKYGAAIKMLEKKRA